MKPKEAVFDSSCAWEKGQLECPTHLSVLCDSVARAVQHYVCVVPAPAAAAGSESTPSYAACAGLLAQVLAATYASGVRVAARQVPCDRPSAMHHVRQQQLTGVHDQDPFLESPPGTATCRCPCAPTAHSSGLLEERHACLPASKHVTSNSFSLTTPHHQQNAVRCPAPRLQHNSPCKLPVPCHSRAVQRLCLC